MLRNIAGSFFPLKGKSHAPYEPRASTANQTGWGTPGRKSKGIGSKRSVQMGQTAGWRERVAPNLQNDPDVRGLSRWGPFALSVHQQNARPVDQRASDLDALLHAARQFRRVAILEAREADLGQEIARLGQALALGHALHLEAEGDIVDDAAPGK